MKKLTFILSIVLIILTSCQKAPVANFTVDKSSAYIDETVQFLNQSTDSKSFVWDFGDNGTSTAQNPTHTYKTGGPKTVSLTVSNSKEDDICLSKIRVYDGNASYQVKNATNMILTLMSYYWDGDEIQDFYLHKDTERQGLTDTIFTSRSIINLGGLLNGETFIVIEDFPIVKNTHNILEINSNTDIYSINPNEKSANKEWNLLNEHLKK